MSIVRVVFAIGAATCASLLPAWTGTGSGRAASEQGGGIPAAPADLVAAQGARDRKLYVVPSLDLVVARLGDNGSREDSSFNDAFWERLIEAAPGSQPG